MQPAGRKTDSASVLRVYRNRPYSPAFDSPPPVPLNDVIYLVDEDLRFGQEIAACFSALGIKVIAFQSAAQ